jgi:hypothetical protein
MSAIQEHCECYYSFADIPKTRKSDSPALALFPLPVP